MNIFSGAFKVLWGVGESTCPRKIMLSIVFYDFAEIPHTVIVIVTKCSIKANAHYCIDLVSAFTTCL